MRRTLYIIVATLLLGLVGCREKQLTPAPSNTLKIANDCKVARLNSGLDSFEVTFTCLSDWHITTIGHEIEVSPMRGSGSHNPQTITIKVLRENNSDVALMRGSLSICLDKYSTKYQIKVMQCADSERTIFAWLFGTSLSYYFNINVDCMKQAVANDILGNDRLIVFVQSSRSKGCIKEIFYDSATKTSKECVIREIELPETLTGEEFGSYLCEMMDIAPSERYAMIVGGHSTAWLPTQPSSGGVELSVGAKYAPNWMPAVGAEMTRTIGENNVKLNIEEFAKGLSVTNQKFDWLYFDVCFMSSIEASYALRNHADYIVGSPCEIMGYGSPFDLMLDELVADDLEGACRTYRDYYANDYYGSKSGCIATIVCRELDALASKMKALTGLEVADDLDILSLQTYEGRSAHIFFDVEDYVMNAYGDKDVVADFRSQLNKTIINRFHTEKFYSTYNAQMNAINHFSGVNFTPDDGCVAVVEQQLDALMREDKSSSDEYLELREQLDELIYYHPSLKKTDWYKATH